jgi:hypothetical protein
MVGNLGVEPSSSCSQGKRDTVSLVPGGSGRNRTGSPTLAKRDRYLSCHPHCRREGSRRPGRLGSLPEDAHAMEFSIGKPAKRRAGTAGIEPALAVLETAVLPLNYVPEENQGKEKPPVRFP